VDAKQSNSKKMVTGESLPTQPVTAENVSDKLAIGETLYFTAAELREGKVDISRALACMLPPSRIVQLLAELPFVLDVKTTTTPPVKQQTSAA
jgi:hypothetical protein